MDEPVSQPPDIVISSSVDQILENLPVGSVSRAIGNNLYGINLRQTGNPVPRDKSSHGFTFFGWQNLHCHGRPNTIFG